MPELEYVTGTVSRVRGEGFLLDDAPERWLNRSKYGLRPELPVPGQQVRVGLDEKLFVRSVQPLSSGPAPAARAQDRETAPPPSREEPSARGGTHDAAPSWRGIDGLTTEEYRLRAQLLQTATTLLTAGGTPADLYDVINAAAVLWRWTTAQEVVRPASYGYRGERP